MEESQVEEEGEAEEEVESWRKRDVAHRERVLGFLSVLLAVYGSDPDLWYTECWPHKLPQGGKLLPRAHTHL